MLVLLLAPACDPPQCRVRDAEGAILQGRPVQDCGGLIGPTADNAEYIAARDCALGAISAHTGFRVGWSDGGIDSGYYRVLIGFTDDDVWRTFYIEGYSEGSVTEPYAIYDRYECSALEDLGNCGDPRNTFCLSCREPRQIGDCGDPP